MGIIHILAFGNDAEMNYYSALTREEVLSYRKTWMNFENTMVSETSQSPKDKHSMAPLDEVSTIVKLTGAGNGQDGFQGLREEAMRN